ncbi:MAG: hypothetical protein AAB776_01060 [Patescibacteria group bacterium]
MFRKLLPLLALGPVIVSTYALPQAWFGTLALLSYLVACGLAIGPRLAPATPRPLQLGLGAMVTIAGMSILGSAVYYSATVTSESLLLVLIVIAAIAGVVQKPSDNLKSLVADPHLDAGLFTLGLVAILGWWLAVLTHDVSEPVRSLWSVLEPFTLIALGLATACTLALILRRRSAYLALILLAALLFSATSVAAAMYGLGYGFDPFLHRATVSHIAEHGTITPKPLYYIGQYALELIGVKLFALPLAALDAFLVPFLAAFGIVIALAGRQASLKAPSIMLASLLFLPLAAFVQTTPQALAFVFTAWTLFTYPRPRLVPAIFALAAVITHPLAGIGAIVYVVLISLDDLPDRYRSLGLASIATVTLAAAVAVPLAFVAQAKLAHLSLSFSLQNIFKLWQLPISSFLTTQYNAWGDTAYFFIGNTFLIVLVLAIIGIILTPKTKSGWYVPGLVAAAMFMNFIILSLSFDFTFLIAYERLDFALRLLTLTTLFLLPYVAVLFSLIWAKLQTAPVGLRVGLVVLLSIFFVSNVYAAYPRHDNYARSSGFNVGPADFEAVTAIEQSAAGQDYIVLSNQALASAAIQELGFKQYYHDDIFFYPIPTGGPLYQHFLTMVEERPSTDTITAAMDLAGVDLAFFAVHDYWWQAPQIIENTKTLADDWFAVSDNAVTIFIFTR